jgi:hypothetical protein
MVRIQPGHNVMVPITNLPQIKHCTALEVIKLEGERIEPRWRLGSLTCSSKVLGGGDLNRKEGVRFCYLEDGHLGGALTSTERAAANSTERRDADLNRKGDSDLNRTS